VPDAGNGRVQAYTQQGQFLLQWGAPGSADGQFNHPLVVTSGTAGNVYVLDKDNSRVQKFASVSTPVARRSWGALKARYQ
jgi:DNA-binding beta-propeller fold protein YncE